MSFSSFDLVVFDYFKPERLECLKPGLLFTRRWFAYIASMRDKWWAVIVAVIFNRYANNVELAIVANDGDVHQPTGEASYCSGQRREHCTRDGRKTALASWLLANDLFVVLCHARSCMLYLCNSLAHLEL